MNSIQEQKTRLRAQLKQHRSEISGNRRQQKNIAVQQRLLSLPALKVAKSVFCFISYGTEVDTHDIIDRLMAQGKQLAVPRIIDSGPMHAVPFNDWAELETAQLGILSPRSTMAPQQVFDITITPGLGFTENGERLGFGKGYYDAWFQANEAGLKIALAYETQILDTLPTTEQDIRVDMIITEARLIRI